MVMIYYGNIKKEVDTRYAPIKCKYAVKPPPPTNASKYIWDTFNKRTLFMGTKKYLQIEPLPNSGQNFSDRECAIFRDFIVYLLKYTFSYTTRHTINHWTF